MEVKRQNDEDLEREKSRLFKDELMKFNTLHGRENFKVPQIGGRELDLYKLFKEVISKGGSKVVSDNKYWKEIVNALDLPASCTSASFTLRNHYNRCLYSYEQYYYKSQNNSNSDNIVLNTNQNNNNYMAPTNPNNISQPSVSQEQKFLGKKILRTDTDYNIIFRYQNKSLPDPKSKNYNRKVRLINAIPDTRRIVLAFESHITSEIVWSLNILTLFSANQNISLLIDSHPYLIESMTNYLYYCVNNLSEFYFIIDLLEGNISKGKYKDKILSKRAKSYNESTTFTFLDEINSTINLSTLTKKNKDLKEIEELKKENLVSLNSEEVTEYELMEHLISIIQIVRNLSYTRANEPSIIKCNKFMNIMYLLFIYSNILDIRYNILDILTNLSKHIILKEMKYPYELLEILFDCLKSNDREKAEQSLECFRRLTFPAGNEEFLEKLSDDFFEELVGLLISYKTEVRENALEIILTISDQLTPNKVRLGKQFRCIQRLVALVCSHSVENKISKLAALTLANLSSVPSIMTMITPYEQELFVAATTDESISKILLGILNN